MTMTMDRSYLAATEISGFDIYRPFKGKSLPDLLEEAARRQALIHLAGLTDVFGLQAVYDIENEEWTGKMYNYVATLGSSLHETG